VSFHYRKKAIMVSSLHRPTPCRSCRTVAKADVGDRYYSWTSEFPFWENDSLGTSTVFSIQMSLRYRKWIISAWIRLHDCIGVFSLRLIARRKHGAVIRVFDKVGQLRTKNPASTRSNAEVWVDNSSRRELTLVPGAERKLPLRAGAGVTCQSRRPSTNAVRGD
jgi:hypothetical protein